MPRNFVALLDSQKGQDIVKKACKESGVRFEAFEELLEVEIEQTGKKRRTGLWTAFDDILDRIESGEKH